MNLALYCARMTGYSGVEMFTRDLALAMRARGHGVEVHAGDWQPTHADPLKRAGVDVEGERPSGRKIDFAIAPKYLPMHWAHETGARCIQVIHSEHSTDVPLPHQSLRGVVTIRNSQKALLLQEPWLRDLPHAMIRNPVSMIDHPARSRRTAPEWDGILVSDLDDMKINLAEEYQRKVGGRVALVGSLRSELKIPAGCEHVEGGVDDVGAWYARAGNVCSYRLARAVPEALHGDVPVWVRGGLEPERPTREDGPDDWKIVKPGELDLEPFRPGVVARQWTEFLERLA